MMLFYFFALIYFLFFITLWIGIFKLDKRKNNEELSFSIIVAARNEENNLPKLIESLTSQDYNNYEIIIANDRSTDNTQSLLLEASKKYKNLHCVDVKEHHYFIGKKNALRTAIDKSEGEILLFTDADCFPNKNWIKSINKCYTSKVDIVAGVSPLYKNYSEKINPIKNFERFAIFAVTAGSFGWNWGLTCAARNFSYRREIYDKVKGYSGIGHLRSGDDDLMLMKMAKVSKGMNFCFEKESYVPSLDKTNVSDQIQLETRRASKLKEYSLPLQLLLVSIFIFYTMLFASYFSLFFTLKFLTSILVITAIKLFIEGGTILTFLIKVKEKRQFIYFLLAELLYLPYFIIFALKGTFGKFIWKE